MVSLLDQNVMLWPECAYPQLSMVVLDTAVQIDHAGSDFTIWVLLAVGTEF